LDNVTHSLFALTIARTPLGRGRGAAAALLLASNAPDIDAVTAVASTANYLQWHRGPTHGLLGLVVLPLLTAGVVWAYLRFKGARNGDGARSFAGLVWVSIVGLALHIAMDVPTSYGTRVLSPFDWHWFSSDWMPIIDIYLMVALAAGLYFGRSSDAARRWNVTIVLVLMIANYGVRGLAHHRAVSLAPRLFGPTLPAACEGAPTQGPIVARWPVATPRLPPPGEVRCLIEIAAIPTFTSPFEWRVIAKMSNAYELHDIDVLDPRFRTPARESEVLWRLVSRYPNQWSIAAETAASTRIGLVFLGFSRFPAARTFRDGGSQTVQFTDMRFLTQLTGQRFSATPAGRAGGPRGRGRGFGPNSRSIFTATIRLDREGRVIEERLGP
jgi:membrane-bound metal-dependent hydrolase YbcI (DUF457 family)